ncbi:hypothetical protein SASPL_151171 [Salvia splendens]|uniref:Proteinase inhibitor I13 n=1 Tax=Salvia splendens TaxID=180675 RepID=A0A8X8Z355_SALSN|nr:hypothetical protein SASPL_151171 [Salvia splendens]
MASTTLFILLSLNMSFISFDIYEFMCVCTGKDSWLELVGKKGEEAAIVIESENPYVKAIVLKDGTTITKDFCCDSVCVWVDDCGYVVRTPIIT